MRGSGSCRTGLIPAAAVVLDAVVAILRAPGSKISSAIQHFAARWVFRVVMPESPPSDPAVLLGGGVHHAAEFSSDKNRQFQSLLIIESRIDP